MKNNDTSGILQNISDAKTPIHASLLTCLPLASTPQVKCKILAITWFLFHSDVFWYAYPVGVLVTKSDWNYNSICSKWLSNMLRKFLAAVTMIHANTRLAHSEILIKLVLLLFHCWVFLFHTNIICNLLVSTINGSCNKHLCIF